MQRKSIASLILVGIISMAAGIGFIVGVGSQRNQTGILTFTKYQDVTATTTTTTQTVNPPAYNGFSEIMLTHLTWIAALITTALLIEYSSDSSVIFEGLAGGFAGTYSHKANVSALWNTMLNQSSGISINNFSATVLATSNEIAINSSFNFIRYFKPDVGSPPSCAVVAAYAVFNRSGNGWLISTEIWRFYSYPLPYQ